MNKWILNIARVLLAGLAAWGMTCYIPQETAIASPQFEQGAGYQTGAYDHNAAQPTAYNWTRQSRFVGPAIPHQKWVFSDEVCKFSPVIGSDGIIYIGCQDNGKICAINPDGTKKWSFSATSVNNSYWPSTSPAIGMDDTIYYGCPYGYTFAVNSDGSKRWSFPATISFTSTPVIGVDGTIYAGSGDANKNLYAISPDGKQKWCFTAGNSIMSLPAIGVDGTVYIGTYGKKLHAINPDGTLKWSFDTVGYVLSPAIGADGTIYVGTGGYKSGDYRLYAINPNGTEKWSFLTGNWDVRCQPAIGADGTIYVCADKLYAINPNGTEKWSFPALNVIENSPVIGADGTIYVGIDDNFYAINPDGTQRWALPIKNDQYSSPAIGSDGTIYVVSGGKLCAISDESKPSVAIRILINNIKQNFPQPPVMINDRVMVPLRGIFEALGATVSWDDQTQSVTATKGSTTIKLTIGDSTAYKDGKPVILDQPAQMINEKTMVPVRFVSEALGAEVKWDGDTRTVIINTTDTSVNGLLGSYYQYYANPDDDELRFQRVDGNINFNWGNGTPDQPADLLGDELLIKNKFKVIWNGYIAAPETGIYKFWVESEDQGLDYGVQVKVGDELGISDWDGKFDSTNVFTVPLEKGTYPIFISYYHNQGPAKIKLYWRILDKSGKTLRDDEIIPKDYFSFDPQKERNDVPLLNVNQTNLGIPTPDDSVWSKGAYDPILAYWSAKVAWDTYRATDGGKRVLEDGLGFKLDNNEYVFSYPTIEYKELVQEYKITLNEVHVMKAVKNIGDKKIIAISFRGTVANLKYPYDNNNDLVKDLSFKPIDWDLLMNEKMPANLADYVGTYNIISFKNLTKEIQDYLLYARNEFKDGILDQDKLLVHEGFGRSANYVLNKLNIDYSDKNTIYWLSGHSLGGSLGELFALDLAEHGVSSDRIICYGFGSAPVGNKKLVSRAIEKQVSGRIHKIWNKGDPVGVLGAGNNVYTLSSDLDRHTIKETDSVLTKGILYHLEGYIPKLTLDAWQAVHNGGGW